MVTISSWGPLKCFKKAEQNKYMNEHHLLRIWKYKIFFRNWILKPAAEHNSLVINPSPLLTTPDPITLTLSHPNPPLDTHLVPFLSATWQHPLLHPPPSPAPLPAMGGRGLGVGIL
jgi:hypothetical protein